MLIIIRPVQSIDFGQMPLQGSSKFHHTFGSKINTGRKLANWKKGIIRKKKKKENKRGGKKSGKRNKTTKKKGEKNGRKTNKREKEKTRKKTREKTRVGGGECCGGKKTKKKWK